MITEKPDLSQEDLDRVNEYLNSPIHKVERPPFNPWLFLGMTITVVTTLLGLAILITNLAGIPLK